MSRLEDDVWQPYQEEDVVVIAMSSSVIGNEDPTDLQEYVHGMGLTMPVLADYSASVYRDYTFTSPGDPDFIAPYPREYVIDKEGKFLYLAADIDVSEIIRIIEDNLSK